ncbi:MULTISPECIES: nitrogen fixation protein NifM [unclassified Brenneria]|uniref:nitrogen fixation protein NifM n=1 Tax=unclassified Brenneria TaxID=2634434 RepID=UPI0018F0DBF6|nr:nitrogen fixation protein NifM [Brenneria sp. L3-3C-1]MBJ7220853.1 nitrogen fixation protein NifM [Brenneria sp. L3-3C-1]MEE3642092.1 nitrogen fixation protein NifM [Brenneria sp. L3_3C_1]
MTACKTETFSMWQRYCQLKLSLSLYHCLPWQLTSTQQAEFSQRLAHQWRLESAIQAQAKQQGIRADEQSIITAQYVLRTFFDDEPAWHDALRRAGINETGLRQALAHEATLTAMLETVADRAPPVSDSEIETGYQQHRSRFQQPEKRLAHHLLLVVDETLADSGRDSVADRMATLQRRLQIDPRRFSRLAKRFSECPTALEGGKLGWVKPGMLYPELDRVLFSLEADALSPVVESPMGLHILWCQAIQPAGELPKTQALAQIRQQWRETRRQQYQRRWLAEILR